MPLIVLLVLVVGGIVGIAVLLHLIGLSKAKVFDQSSARAAWLREWPQACVQDIDLSQDHRVALIHSTHGPGLVWAMGADSAARLAKKVEISPHERGLFVSLNSFDAPRIKANLSPQQVSTWRRVLMESDQ